MVSLIRKQENISRKVVCILLYGAIVSFCFTAGEIYDTSSTGSVFSGQFVKKSVVFAIIFSAGMLFAFFICRCLKLKTNIKIASPIKNGPSRTIMCLLPLCCYFISLLSIFPGIFSYDCWQEWDMVEKGIITSHHPVLHVLILGGLVSFSNRNFGTGNVGIFIYVLLQVCFLLIVLRRIFIYMHEKGTNPLLQWCALLFVSFSPIINLYALVTSKDTLFAVFELLFLLELIRMHEEKDYLMSKKNITVFVFASLGAMIFRNNGLYIVVITDILMLLICKGRRTRLLMSYVIIGVLYLLYTGPFYHLFAVEAGSKREMLSVPIQQLARVHQYNIDDFSAEELDVMYSVIGKDYWNQYIPTCADSVKNGFDDEAFSLVGKDFLKMWIEQGIKHPAAYVNAFLLNTVDYWYPLAVNDDYAWLYGKDEKTGDFLDYRVAEPGKETVIIKSLHDFYYYLSTDLSITSKLIPALFLNPGVYLLIWVAVMLSDIANKRSIRVLVHIALLVTFLTVLLGPMVQVRYIVVLYFAVPLWALNDAASDK